MKVLVNGEPIELEDQSTVHDLLKVRSLADKPCAVEVNKEVVPKRQHGEHALAEGDHVEIVTLVGGG